MATFNIGDTVTTPYGYGAGVVIDISSYSIGVRHLKYNDHMHDCRRKCEMGYGWYYSPSNLEILKKVTPKTKQELIIEKIKYLDYKFKMRNTVFKESVPAGYDNEEDEEEDYDDSEDEEVTIRW